MSVEGRSPGHRSDGSRLGGGAASLTLLLLSLLAACAAPGRENPFGTPSDRQDAVVLRVENRNTRDVDLYVRPSGRRTRIGTVSALGLEFFEIPWPMGLPLDVEIELMGGERYRLPPFPMRGMRVQLYVSPELRQSRLYY